jgi:hypothetical protein
MIRKIGIALGGVVVGVLLYAGFGVPKHFEITRSVTVKATPEVIFPYINGSQKMDEWMPWKSEDPTVVMTYSGPESGVGAITHWTSKGDMGVGTAEIIESRANQSVKTKLTYTKPMKMEQETLISLQVIPQGTVVTWMVYGESDFLSRLFRVFVNLDKEVGGQFEKGLKTLQGIVEKA